jgi:hypothetical protein
MNADRFVEFTRRVLARGHKFGCLVGEFDDFLALVGGRRGGLRVAVLAQFGDDLAGGLAANT